MTGKVKIQGKMSASFENVGQKQGDALPTLLFNLCLENIIKVKTDPGGKILVEQGSA